MDDRSEYVEKLSAEIVERDTQIDRLKDGVEHAMEGAANGSATLINELQHKRDEAARKLQGISIAGDHEWEELKAGTELVWSEVRTLVHDAIVNIT